MKSDLKKAFEHHVSKTEDMIENYQSTKWVSDFGTATCDWGK